MHNGLYLYFVHLCNCKMCVDCMVYIVHVCLCIVIKLVFVTRTRPETNKRSTTLCKCGTNTFATVRKSITACLCLLEQGNEQGTIQWVLIVHARVSCSRVEVGMPRHLQSCRHVMHLPQVVAGLEHATTSDSYTNKASFDGTAVQSLGTFSTISCQLCAWHTKRVSIPAETCTAVKYCNTD